PPPDDRRRPDSAYLHRHPSDGRRNAPAASTTSIGSPGRRPLDLRRGGPAPAAPPDLMLPSQTQLVEPLQGRRERIERLHEVSKLAVEGLVALRGPPHPEALGPTARLI